MPTYILQAFTKTCEHPLCDCADGSKPNNAGVAPVKDEDGALTESSELCCWYMKKRIRKLFYGYTYGRLGRVPTSFLTKDMVLSTSSP